MYQSMKIQLRNRVAVCGLSLLASSMLHAADLPDPDGKPADMTKPVQVFLIMGQSNTLEMGKVTPELGGLYPFLVDDAGKETVRQDVRNVSVMEKRGNMRVYRNEWLTLAGKGKIGIETGIGHQLGNAIDAPVMVLKSSIGNRSLGWDLLPPGSKKFLAEVTERDGKKVSKVFAGYKDAPDSWEADPAKGIDTPAPPWLDWRRPGRRMRAKSGWPAAPATTAATASWRRDGCTRGAVRRCACG